MPSCTCRTVLACNDWKDLWFILFYSWTICVGVYPYRRYIKYFCFLLFICVKKLEEGEVRRQKIESLILHARFEWTVKHHRRINSSHLFSKIIKIQQHSNFKVRSDVLMFQTLPYCVNFYQSLEDFVSLNNKIFKNQIIRCKKLIMKCYLYIAFFCLKVSCLTKLAIMTSRLL
jgi:hypothetical protein